MVSLKAGLMTEGLIREVSGISIACPFRLLLIKGCAGPFGRYFSEP